MIKLSVVIITFNEEVNIERCLLSVKNIADEVIVVDSFSTDKTEEICNRHKVTFIQNKFKGHIEQKNWALDQANFEYVLSLDADEAVSEKLEKSILEVKLNWKSDTYKMNRLTNYCGDWIKHGTWYPDTKLRLAKRDTVTWGGLNPHDRLISNKEEKAIHLKGDILHYSYYSVHDHLVQLEKLSQDWEWEFVKEKELELRKIRRHAKNLRKALLYLRRMERELRKKGEGDETDER